MPTLRHAVTAGRSSHPEISRQFTQATGLALGEGYGQTETTLLLAHFSGWPVTPGSMGVASPYYNVKLQNADGTPTPVGRSARSSWSRRRTAAALPACSPAIWPTRNAMPRPGRGACITPATQPGRRRTVPTGFMADLMI
ncbi:MAG: AMP-binding protein [Evtepia sp.]